MGKVEKSVGSVESVESVSLRVSESTGQWVVGLAAGAKHKAQG